MNNENITATGTKRVRFDEPDAGMPDAPALKRTRAEAKSANLSRVKWRQNDKNHHKNLNKNQIKMIKRLEPINDLLASLPAPIARQLEVFATSTLSNVISMIHCERRTHFHESTPSFFPSSTRFDFELTIKKEFESNKEFQDMKQQAEAIIVETKDSLRKMIVSCQKIEENGAKEKILNSFVNELVLVFKIYSIYTRTMLKKLSPPYDNEEASELLLQHFIKHYCANNEEFYEFLHVDKDELTKLATTRRAKIKYISDSSRTTDTDLQSNCFIKYAENDFFPKIKEASIDLIEEYKLSCDKEEAFAVSNALQKATAAHTITAETAKAISTEQSVDHPTMLSLIDERIDAKLSKNSKVARPSQAVSTKTGSGSTDNSNTPPTKPPGKRPPKKTETIHPPFIPYYPQRGRGGRGRSGRGRGWRGRGRGRGRGVWHRGGRGRN